MTHEIRRWLSVVGIGIVCSTAGIAGMPGTLPGAVARRIDTAEARRHLTFLASDALGGRDTPSRGLDTAAAYIVRELQASGVQPVQGSYFHNYILERVNLALPTSMTIDHNGASINIDLVTGFVPFDNTGEGSVKANRVVFAGFGITASEFGYDDYAGIDVRGAIVLIMRSEPLSNTDSTWFAGARHTRHSSLWEKVRNARAHGAAALLVIDPTRSVKQLSVNGYPWPSLFPKVPKEALPLVLPDSQNRSMPALHVGDSVVNVLFGSLAEILQRIAAIDSTRQPMSFEVSGRRVNIDVRLQRDSIHVRNIVGFVQGTAATDEYVIMGAHYDHIGVLRDTNAVDTVFNGADDNGSGTVGLLMTAKAMAEASIRPTRSMLFIHFSGEEKGLLGSKAYAKSPILPLDKCVAMINMDMIGRCENNKLSIGGNQRCPDLTTFNVEENLALDAPYALAYDIEHYFFRSDQASFARKRIPVLFYFTGEHADYHKLTDEIHKINFTDLVGVARLAASTAWRAAQVPRTKYIPAGWED